MTNPREHGFPSRARLSGRWGKSRNAARPRASAARLWAIVVTLTAGLLLAGGFAWARGGEKPWAPWDPVPDVAPATAVDVQTDQKPKETRAMGLAVCVRLCDGFFFPSATSAGSEEVCAAQCPDAPTARYTEPAGSERIEDAVSTHGALYTALPTANRYQTTLDDTCRCHRSRSPDYSESLLNDSTLRKGDVVMTANGFVVFQGAKTRPTKSSDFVALSKARALSKDLRAALVDMERAGASQRRVAADTTPRAPAPKREALIPLASTVSTK